MSHSFQYGLSTFSDAMKASRPTTVEESWVRLSQWTIVNNILASVADEYKDAASKFLSESEEQIKKYEALIKTFASKPPPAEEHDMPSLVAIEQTV